MSIVDLSRRPIALVVRFGALGAFLVLAMAGCRGTAQSSLTALPTRAADLEVSLGAIDDSVLAFSTISGLTVDRDGRMYVLQSTEPIVTVLNPDGTLHQRFGRRGQGPGEFSAAGWVGWWGDTLWVTDMFQQRVSLFYRGQHVRTSRFPPVHPGRGGMPGSHVASQWPMADGSCFTVLSWRFERPAGSPENYLPIIRTTDAGTETVVARLQESFPLSLIIQGPDGGPPSYGLLCSPTFPCNPSSDFGERIAILDRPFASGPQVAIRLTVLEASGDTAYSREYMVDAEPLTDEQWDAKLQDVMARRNRPGLPAPRFGIRELEKASRRPGHWPSATGVILGLDSSVWIGLADLPWRADRDWAVLDSRGTPLFKVSLPRDFYPSTASATCSGGYGKTNSMYPMCNGTGWARWADDRADLPMAVQSLALIVQPRQCGSRPFGERRLGRGRQRRHAPHIG